MDKNKLMEQLRKTVREVVEEEMQPNTSENKFSLPAGSTDKNKGKRKRPLTAFEKRFAHLQPGESASLKGDPKNVKKAPVKESYTLEEFLGMLEEVGYQLDEISIDKMVRARDARYYRAQQDREKARELQKKAHPGNQWRIDHEAGQLRGWAQDERDKAKRTQAHIDRKLAAGKLQERNKENKAKKDAEITQQGFDIRRTRGGAVRGTTPDVELVKNKQRGRRDAKTVYGDPTRREPGKYLPANMDKKDLMTRDFLKGYARNRVRFGPLSEPKPNLPEEKAHKPKLATSGGAKGPPSDKTKSKSSIGTRTGYGKDTPSYTKPNKK